MPAESIPASHERSRPFIARATAPCTDQIWIPSKSVPDPFHRGCPAVSVVSRCTCDSTNGGEMSLPPGSISRAADPALPGAPGPPPPRLPRREPRVEVHVRLHERRRDEPPPGVYLARRRPVDAGRHALDPSSSDGHVNEAAVEPGSAQDQVKHNPVSPHTSQ